MENTRKTTVLDLSLFQKEMFGSKRKNCMVDTDTDGRQEATRRSSLFNLSKTYNILTPIETREESLEENLTG